MPAWFDKTRDLAVALTEIRSVTGEGSGEANLADFLERHLKRLPSFQSGDLDVRTIESDGDPLRRPSVFAHLHGTTKDAVLLLGHFDTVDTADYGALEPLATRPRALTEKVAAGAMGEELARAARSGAYLFGRGLLDMKAGVAANVVALEALSAISPRPHVLFAATPDEEVNSVGVKTLRAFLARYAQDLGLTLRVCLNTDYSSAVHAGDKSRHVYLGSIGKILPAITVRGLPSHASEPHHGLDPNAVIAEISHRLIYNAKLADQSDSEMGPTPVALRMADDKLRYDTQTAVTATMTLNMLSLSRSPSQQFALVEAEVQKAVKAVLRRRLEACPGAQALDVPVYRFADAAKEAERQGLLAGLRGDAARLPKDLDLRERCRQTALLALAAAKPSGPAVILYFATGLIPRVDSGEALREAITASLRGLESELGETFSIETHFPYISDLSFLASSADEQDDVFFANFPPELSAPTPPPPLLEVPVVNVGTYGYGPHRSDERLDLAYSCEKLPQILVQLTQGLTKQ